jgi:hypothetical protein
MCETKVVVCVKFKGNAIQAAADATRCDGQTAILSWGVDQSATAVMAYDEKEKKFYFFRPSGEQLKIMVEIVDNDGLAVFHEYGPTWNQVLNLPKWGLR